MTRSKASNEAQYRYNKEHLKRIPLDVQLSEYDFIKASADAAGVPVNRYIKEAIRQRMDREGFRQADQAGDPAGDPVPLGEIGAAEVGGVNPPSTEN